MLRFFKNPYAEKPIPSLLIESAKSCYIMARSMLNINGCLGYYPASIFVMHHSLECFLKAFLLKENLSFNTGKNGHKLLYLLELGRGKENLVFFDEILNDLEISRLLKSMDDFYNSNKYWQITYEIKTVYVLYAFEKFMSVFL
jgi:hypothetical protein